MTIDFQINTTTQSFQNVLGFFSALPSVPTPIQINGLVDSEQPTCTQSFWSAMPVTTEGKWCTLRSEHSCEHLYERLVVFMG